MNHRLLTIGIHVDATLLNDHGWAKLQDHIADRTDDCIDAVAECLYDRLSPELRDALIIREVDA